eukprot:Tbor_TRINITY_DN5692_c2_g7::TRINITY_DN5692_c2_g7_i2::g.8202::m.8202
MDELLYKSDTTRGPASCIPMITRIIITTAKKTIPYGSHNNVKEILSAEVVDLANKCNEARLAHECNPSETTKEDLDNLRATHEIAARTCRSEKLHRHLSKLKPGKNIDLYTRYRNILIYSVC